MRSSVLFGCVLIECEGGYPETFLNTAAEQHIPLWDVHRQGASLWCRTFAADYARLRPAARRACVRMRVRRKQGLPFRLRRLGVRLGPVVGLLLFFLILHALSSRIWVIRIAGNEAVTDNTILTALEPLGVRKGAPFNNADLADIRLTALQQLPELTWLTVNQSGSIATVEVKERTAAEPLANTSPVNLVAACDGVIVSINTVQGQAMVHPGDAVTRGDLLISGVMDSTVGPQLKHAAGSVIARTTHTLTATVPLAETVAIPTHTVTQPRLTFFGISVPLYATCTLSGTPTATTSDYPLIAGGVPLPIGMTVTRFQYTGNQTVLRTSEQALAEAEKRLLTNETTLQKTLSVETRSVHTETRQKEVTLTAVYTGTQELAVAVPIG